MSHSMHSTQPSAHRGRQPRALFRVALAAVLMASLAACGGGLLGGGGAGPYERPESTTLTGEVERIEEYANEVDIWTSDRRIVTVRYEEDTPVYYEGTRYEPEALERGDVIRVEVKRTATGGWLAERIDVEVARQDREAREERPEGRDDPYFEPDERRSVSGEILSIDIDRRRMEVDTEQGRRTLTFGRGTPVYFRGQEAEVANLEPGDVVRAEVDTSREPWRVMDFITVVQSRQEREQYGDRPPRDTPWDEPDERPREDWGDAERFSGTVQEVDRRRGEFVLDTERYGLKTVVMPYNASREDRTEFDRLQRGDSVRIEGKRLEQDRIELRAFGWERR